MKFFAGIDLGGTKILTVLANENQEIISKIKIKTSSQKGVDFVLNSMFLTLETVCKEAKIKTKQLSGIGIGVPGPVDKSTGVVYDCPNLPGWKNIKIKDIFESKFKGKTKVENDARVAGLAEVRNGAAKGYKHVFYVTVSTGIGGAIILNNDIYSGAQGAAGEFGQMRLLDGSLFESHFSGSAIEKKFGVSTILIPELIKKSDPGAKKALNYLINGLGTYLANITTLLNPEIIVIGGGVSNLGDLLIEPVQKLVREQAFSISSRKIKVVRTHFGTDSGVLGALELVIGQ